MSNKWWANQAGTVGDQKTIIIDDKKCLEMLNYQLEEMRSL